jgi:hypothetical protein
VTSDSTPTGGLFARSSVWTESKDLAVSFIGESIVRRIDLVDPMTGERRTYALGRRRGKR